MPLIIIRNDITQVNVDAIVNAANSALKRGGGVCGAIFAAAGSEQLRQACDAIGFCDVGAAVITPGFNLPAKYIIHAVGPVWSGGSQGEEQKLASCYRHSLDLAKEHGLESIAFPLISSGIFGYPKDQALSVAIRNIGDFLLENDMTVYLVVYDKSAFSLSTKLFASIEQFIDDNYIDEHHYKRTSFESCQTAMMLEDAMPSMATPRMAPKSARSLGEVVGQLEESFSQMLLRLIDEKGKGDVEVYKKANLDRRLFSKIRSDIHYQASKPTALALAIALELNLDETRDLLARAGFALSHSSRFDLIIEYFIEEGIYNIYEINEALFAFDQLLLGA